MRKQNVQHSAAGRMDKAALRKIMAGCGGSGGGSTPPVPVPIGTPTPTDQPQSDPVLCGASGSGGQSVNSNHCL